MTGLIAFFCIAALFCSASSAGPYYPFRPYGGVRSYYYSGAPVASAVAPYAAAPYAAAPYAAAPYAAAPYAAAPYAAAAAIPAAPVAAAVVPDYYTYAASAALSYPGYGYGYGYPYLGAYNGYPYVKK